MAVGNRGHFLLHPRLSPVVAKEAAFEGQYLGLERCHRFLHSPIAIDLSVLYRSRDEGLLITVSKMNNALKSLDPIK